MVLFCLSKAVVRIFSDSFPSRKNCFSLLSVVAIGALAACSDMSGLSSESNNPHSLTFGPPSENNDVTPSRWIPVADNGGAADFSVIDSPRTDAGQALAVSLGSGLGRNRWDIQAFQDAFAITPDKVYEYKLWVKGDSGALLTAAVETDDYDTIKSKEVYLVGDWQVVAFEFIPSHANIRTPIHFGHPQNRNKTIIVDSVSITLAD